jgi:membrane fusion protein, adhesin transport system
MLSISENTVHIDTEKYKSFEKVSLSRANVLFRRFLIFSFVCVFVILFLPWTQNIRAKGLVTTLTPDHPRYHRRAGRKMVR